MQNTSLDVSSSEYPTSGGNNVTSVELFKNVATRAKENYYSLKDIKIIFYVKPSIPLKISMVFCSSFYFFPKRTKHAWSPKIQSSFPKQWLPGLFPLLGYSLSLWTCKQVLNHGTKTSLKTRGLGHELLVLHESCLQQRSVLQFAPKEQGFVPLILPMTILIGTTHRLMQPPPSPLQTSIPACCEEDGKHQHTASQGGRTRNSDGRAWPTLINVGLGKQWGWARPFPAGSLTWEHAPHFSQEPVGCFNATSVLVVQLQVQREWLLVKGPGFLWHGQEGTCSVLCSSRPQSWKALRATARAPQRGQYRLCPFSIH